MLVFGKDSFHRTKKRQKFIEFDYKIIPCIQEINCIQPT